MNKRHYEAIAAGILTASCQARVACDEVLYQYITHALLRRLADSLASHFEAENPKFKREVFLAAAGYPT